ncbi:helix-turn-helix transcriptional regulator [Salmonella enterica]|nr:helix-turn-helix transcriptional regulator [Salmonella enterica]ECE0152233.1 helix-turn-helix transcriptional regulator [Salmonella enterica subsp. enterica serovar Tallahassee]EGZ4603089.1 helix-turn-helix transcriptional regulator [Salmonella enterica subsp. enterica serovar Miami]EAQ8126033.1 helix-turn-helix transcriptional regulator [Salmonella enterica]EBA1242233.1 helix-turn-helix transcriptional regulator [Salmonella enterica]
MKINIFSLIMPVSTVMIRLRTMIIVVTSCRYFRQGFVMLVENLKIESPSFKKVLYVDDIKDVKKVEFSRAKAIVVDYGQSDIKVLNSLLEIKNRYENSYFILITRDACYESTIENILINTIADHTIDCKNAVRKLCACLAHLAQEEQPVTIIKNARWHQLEKQQHLTRMETMLLPYIVSGKKNKEITRYVNVSGKTVSHHRRNIYRKFSVTNLTGLYKKFDQFL